MCTRACAHTLNDLRTHAREELELLATEEKTFGCSIGERKYIPEDVDLNVDATRLRFVLSMWKCGMLRKDNEGLDVGNR